MAEHIDGPLYYERMGRAGPVMAFVHPNPMDQSCWIFQILTWRAPRACPPFQGPFRGEVTSGWWK